MYFLKKQGYDCDKIFNQDNPRTILLETNIMESSNKSTQHITI